MKIRHVAACAALVGATFVVTRVVYSQDKAPPTPEEIEKAVAKEIAEQGALTDEHKKMAEAVGTWDAEVLMWMAPGEPMRSTGSMTTRTALGGHVIIDEFKGDFMGQPYEGMGVSGYDKNKKKHWSFWCDAMRTDCDRLVGEAEKNGDLRMIVQEPMMYQGVSYSSYEVFRDVDKDHRLLQRFSTPEGKTESVKEMEIRFTRHGAGPFPADAAPAKPETDKK